MHHSPKVSKIVQSVKLFFDSFINKCSISAAMKKKYLFAALFFLYFFMSVIAMTSVSAQVISMYLPNPDGDDNNKEIVEIENLFFLNLSGYSIGDSASNDTLIELYSTNSSRAFIVEEGFLYNSTINASLYSAGATIGNGLGNTADSIFFYAPTGELLDMVSYNQTSEGMYYEHKIINNNETNKNSLSQNQTNQTHDNNSTNNAVPSEKEVEEEKNEDNSNTLTISSALPSFFYVNQTLTKGFMIKNLADQKQDITLTYILFFNETSMTNKTLFFKNITRSRTKETVDIRFDQAGNYTLCGTVLGNSNEQNMTDNTLCENITVVDISDMSCDRNLTLTINTTHLYNNRQFDFGFKVEGMYEEYDIPFVISYSIKEYNGKEEKETRNTSTTAKKHWTPAIKKDYALYILEATLEETGCYDPNRKNNHASTMVIVENRMDEEARIIIDHLYLGSDGVAKRGDILRAKLSVYSGNLSRISKDEQSIRVFVKNSGGTIVSETTQLNIAESFQEATLIVPVMLEYSCRAISVEETYTLVVQSAGNTAKEKFSVRGTNKELCKSSLEEEYTPEFVENAVASVNITNNITIYNNDDIPHTYRGTTNIYRGPKTYSEDVTNGQELTLNPGEERTLSFVNIISALDPGTYKVKITIQKDQQKTTKQFTKDLTLVNADAEQKREKEGGEIISFFSLAQEPNKNVHLFTELKGYGNYTLILESAKEQKEMEIVLNGTTYFFLNMTLFQGKNIFVVSLYDNETRVAAAPLTLYVIDNALITEGNAMELQKQDSSNAITGKAILSAQDTYYRALSSVHAIVLFSLLLFMIALLLLKTPQQNMLDYLSSAVNHKLFKTTSFSVTDEESDKSASDYRNARCTERAH